MPRARPAELTFVMACLIRPIDEVRRQSLRDLALAVKDWDGVIAWTERHRVAGLVAAAVSDASIEVPDAVRRHFVKRSREVLLEEMGMLSELTLLSKAFEEAAVRLAVLKGLAIAMNVYGQVGLRQNRDIDLLIDGADLPRAVGVMEGCGFTQIEPKEPLTPQELSAWSQTHKDMAFRKGSGVIVELHWRLFDNHEFAAGLGQGKPGTLTLPRGASVSTLPTATAFAYMAAHGAQHAWSRLKWLADFANLAGVLDEAQLLGAYREAKTLGLGYVVALGLKLSEELLGFLTYPAVAAELPQGWRLSTLQAISKGAIGGPRPVELEETIFGSTLKTVSRYFLSDRPSYLLRQSFLDFGEVPKSHSSPLRRRLGPLAKIPIWLVTRGRRLARRPQIKKRAS